MDTVGRSNSIAVWLRWKDTPLIWLSCDHVGEEQYGALDRFCWVLKAYTEYYHFVDTVERSKPTALFLRSKDTPLI